MPIIDMKKVYLFGHRQEKDRVFSILQDLGTVEMVELKTSEAWPEFRELLEPDRPSEAASQVDSRRSDIRFCLDFFQRHFPVRKSIVAQFTGSRVDLSREQFNSYINSMDLVNDLYNSCRELEDRLVRIRNEETQSHNLIEDLKPWSTLSVPLELINEGQWVFNGLYSSPTERFSELSKSLEEKEIDFYLEQVYADEENTYFLLIAMQEDKEIVNNLLRSAGVALFSFPGFSDTPEKSIRSLEQKLTALAEEKETILKDVEKLLEHRQMLMACYDHLDNEYEKQQAAANLGCTRDSFMLEGWVPVPVVGDLEKAVNDRTETAIMTTRDPKKGEDVPVLLHNSGPAEPYEVVTRLYSMPKKNELDPTPFMAPFFFLFFGICLSDAGYGILLGLFAFFLYRKLKLEGSGQQLVKLLILGGISAFAFGILLGGYFGDLIPLPPLLFDPLEEPMLMLIGALCIGLLHVYFGMGLQAYRNIKAGKPLHALFDQGFWFIFLNGLIVLLAGFTTVGQVLTLGGALGLIFTQGRSQRSIVLKFLSGLLSLYNVTQYLSDILSYSRLFALSLASVVIGMVINSVGELAAGSIVGYVVLVVILIGGHFFNMIISTLSAYVHTSRLQYLEFFNKFFEGGGRSFQPFRIKNSYVDIAEPSEDA